MNSLPGMSGADESPPGGTQAHLRKWTQNPEGQPKWKVMKPVVSCPHRLPTNVKLLQTTYIMCCSTSLPQPIPAGCNNLLRTGNNAEGRRWAGAVVILDYR